LSLFVFVALTAIGLAYLVLERIRLDHHRKAIPLLIAVTGTRGKSSVAKTLAAVLRESGRRVLAKTTGSEAVLIMPDGMEQGIQRRGRPSIIEQKHVVRLAAQMGVDAAVVEVMSIHPENHLVEAHSLLKPDVVLVTNFRVDHTAAMGDTPEAVASVIALDVPPGARVFVPQSECLPAFRAAVKERGGELIEVPEGTASPRFGRFGENLDLVNAVARSLDIEDRMIRDGIERAPGDIGALGIWRYRLGDGRAPCYLVNAFAANDPESTMLIHEEVIALLGVDPRRCVGLLSLRPDRGDRTLQWVAALREGFLDRFSRLCVVGLHGRALARRLGRVVNGGKVEVLRGTKPEEITRTVLSGIADEGGVLFGFGNIGGVGQALVAHWSKAGKLWLVEG
jgi:poly-gamma-glutamate synthase PgsB/CapB